MGVTRAEHFTHNIRSASRKCHPFFSWSKEVCTSFSTNEVNAGGPWGLDVTGSSTFLGNTRMQGIVLIPPCIKYVSHVHGIVSPWDNHGVAVLITEDLLGGNFSLSYERYLIFQRSPQLLVQTTPCQIHSRHRKSSLRSI